MKKSLFCGFVALAFVAALSVACDLTPRISSAVLCKSVDKDNKAVDQTTSFKTSDKEIHCLVTLGYAPDNTKVRAKWIVDQSEGATAGEEVAKTDLNAGGKIGILDFSLTPPSGGFPTGSYHVEVYLNPEGEKPEPPMKLPFTIQ